MSFNKKIDDYLINHNSGFFKAIGNRYSGSEITEEWKQDIFEKLKSGLQKEGFAEEQIGKIAEAVWRSLYF